MNEEEIFHQALARNPEERAAFLERACAGDVALPSPLVSPAAESSLIDVNTTRLSAVPAALSVPFTLSCAVLLLLGGGAARLKMILPPSGEKLGAWSMPEVSSVNRAGLVPSAFMT